MRRFRTVVTLVAAALTLAAIGSPTLSAGRPVSEREFEAAMVHTDGNFRPGSLETIRVSGFPRAGRAEIAFFPSAICESQCAAESRFAGRTNKAGSGILHVRVPGYFFNAEEHRTYFLDLERIDLHVLWMGKGKEEFAVGTPRHKPVFHRQMPNGHLALNVATYD